MPFYEDELAILLEFFNCKNAEDLQKAAKRYEDLLWFWGICPHDDRGVSLLALTLASELYVEFSNLEKGFSKLENPLLLKHPPKNKGGPPVKLRNPKKIDTWITEVMEKGDAQNREEAVKQLQRSSSKNDSVQGKPKSILRGIQKYKQRCKEDERLAEERKFEILSEFSSFEE